MRLTEVERDLFSVDPQYSLAHCISADFALGAGIAKQFDTRFNMRYELFEKYGSYHFTGGRCLKIGSVFNLVTKDKCWQKPTYKALREALEDEYVLRRCCYGKRSKEEIYSAYLVTDS